MAGDHGDRDHGGGERAVTTEDEITHDELVSLEAAFLRDMLETNCLIVVEIRDAFESAITEYRKVTEAVKEPFSSTSPEPTLLTDEEIARVRRRMVGDHGDSDHGGGESMSKHEGIEYKKRVELARGILNKLTGEEIELIKKAIGGYQEKIVFKNAYRMTVGDWDIEDGLDDDDWVIPESEILFVLTDEDAHGMARAMIDRELTDDEMHIVREGIEAGLGDWLFVMRFAIREAVST